MKTERRSRTRRTEDVVVIPLRIPSRRIPGTLALATTNLMASAIGYNSQSYMDIGVLRYVQRITPFPVWSGLFALSGSLLIAAVLTKRWSVFNVGAALSLFVWATVTLSIFAVWFRGGTLSPIGLAMAWWMLIGQVSMLATPLVNKWGDEPL